MYICPCIRWYSLSSLYSSIHLHLLLSRITEVCALNMYCVVYIRMGRDIFSYWRNITSTWNKYYVELFLKLTLQSGRLNKTAVFIHTEKFSIEFFNIINIRGSVYHDRIYENDKKMQLCRIIYYSSLAALHVSSDIFAHHHQEHLNCIYRFRSYTRMLLSVGIMGELERSSNSPMIPTESNIRV